MRNALLVAVNALRVTLRGRARLLVYFLMPILGVVLSLFISFGGQNAAARVGVVDADRGRFSRDLVASIVSWGRYVPEDVSEADLSARLAAGSLDAGLVIPAGWSDSLLTAAPLSIRVQSIKGDQVMGWLAQIVQEYAGSIVRISAASGGNATTFDTMFAASQAVGPYLHVEKLHDVHRGKQVTLSSMGFLVYFLMLGAGITMQLVLADRRARTYRRIRTAPVRGIQYIAGNGLAGFLIILAQIVAVMVALKYVFKVQTFVPDLLLFLILMIFGVVAVGVAMAITAFARSSQAASVLLNLILTPTSMIAGCFWPSSIMPVFLQRVGLFLPQRWTLDAIHASQTAAGGGAVGLDLLVVAAFAVALFLLAGYRFSRYEESGQFV